MDNAELTIIICDDDELLLSTLTEMIDFLGPKTIACSTLAELSAHANTDTKFLYFFVDFSIIKKEYVLFEQLIPTLNEKTIIISGSDKETIDSQVENLTYKFLHKPFGLSDIQVVLSSL